MSHVDDGTLHAYLDGELSPPEAQSVEAHVAQCPACRMRLEEERALIARAGELLAQAAPPDRELPVFRPGDVKPPARLWWRVRLPLAWAATVALALGIGTYVGGLSSGRVERTVPERPTEVADRLAQNAPLAAPAPASDTPVAVARRRQAENRAPRSQPPAPPAANPLDEESQADVMADSLAAQRGNAREITPGVVAGRAVAKAAAPPAPRQAPVSLGDRGYAMKGEPIGIDSARLLLGRDPLVVPNVPIRAIYRARMIGYSGLVIVEQALDSSTVIEVINGRASPLQLAEVVVSGAGAARRDTQSAGARALLGRRADTAPPTPSPEAAPPAPAAKEKASQAASDFFVDVRGPLSTDSLVALRRLLRPLRP